MRYYAKKAAAVGFLVFLVLWIVGTLRGITQPYPPPAPLSIGLEREYSSQNQWANNLKAMGLIETPLPLVLDNPDVDKIRIVEKTANFSTGTAAFDKDEGLIRSAVKVQGATVFSEKSTGIEPGRKLLIEVGVHPDKFDALAEKLRNVGTLSSASVEQKDRTSEFRTLFAKRQSLKKNLDAMTKLRETKNLTFEDTLKLEQHIQGLEKELQGMNVQFGDLLGKESYYHIHLTLVEYQPGGSRDQTYTVPQRLGNAFIWAVAWWFAVALAAIIAGASIVSGFVLLQKTAATGEKA